ncbi:hypothetical protein QZH41_011739 [Actinostola sp. cb2023]|nr:hypothetical protein QZH41_011739 [Actinostola sp. cb2023]
MPMILLNTGKYVTMKESRLKCQNCTTSNVNDDMKMFWEAQKQVLENPDSRANRWHPKIIRLCLSLWCRSPEAYEQLKDSGMIRLPSGRLLSLYKNSEPEGRNK